MQDPCEGSVFRDVDGVGEAEGGGAEEVRVESEQRGNLKRVASEVRIRKREFSSGDIDGNLG